MMTGKITAMALALAAATALLAGCDSDDDATTNSSADSPQALKPGLYQLDWEVRKLASTDHTKPATHLKIGDKGSVTGCISAKKEADSILFAAPGETCTGANSYMGAGRLSLTLTCTVANGMVNGGAEALFDKEDAIKQGEINQVSAFAGGGDFSMTRAFTAKRTGNCPAAK